MGNFELRWYTWDEEEYILPDGPIQYGRQAEKGLVTKKKLQYRVYQNVAVYAGMPSQEDMARSAKYQWSDWKDVPTVVGDNMFCP
jgi:hypothetical protein